MLGAEKINELDKEELSKYGEKVSKYKDKALKWGKNTVLTALGLGLIAGATYKPVTALANEKEDLKGPKEEVTVPIGEVIDTSVLEPFEWSQDKVTVPVSAVSDEYVEVHFSKKNESSESKGPVSNIRDGEYTQEPEITSDRNDSIEISDFNFQLNYDKGDLKESDINFSLKNNSGNIEDVKLILNGNNQLKPKDGKYDEAVEEFSYFLKGLEEGNLYRGTLKVKGESNSDTIDFKIYPREFVNIADDDNIIIAAHYYPWFTDNGWGDLEYEPSLGKYSSKDEEVINKHIDWATGHGIDTFIMTWNGKSDWTDENIRNNVLESDLIDDINFFIAYGWGGNVGKVNFDQEKYREKFKSDFKYFNEKYFDHSQHLEINGKKPVFLWGSKVFRGDEDKMIGEVRKISNQRGNKLYLIGDELDTVLLEDEPWVENRIEEMEKFDAVSRYNLLYPGFEGNLQDFVDEASEVYSQLKPKIDSDFIPYVQPGYDDRRLRPNANNPIVEREEKSFRDFCKLAEKYTDRDVNMILVTSFNEWDESSQVEPAKSYGLDYLKIIRDELDK